MSLSALKMTPLQESLEHSADNDLNSTSWFFLLITYVLSCASNQSIHALYFTAIVEYCMPYI